MISTFAFGFLVFAIYDITQFFYTNPENCTGLYNDYRNFLLILPLLDYLPLQCALVLQTVNMRKSIKPRDSKPEQLTIPSVFVGYENESEVNDEDQSEHGPTPLNHSNNLSSSDN